MVGACTCPRYPHAGPCYGPRLGDDFEIGETFNLLDMPEDEIRAWLGEDFVDILRRWKAEGVKASTSSATVTAIDSTTGTLTFDVEKGPGSTTTIRVWPELGYEHPSWSVAETFDRPIRSVGRIGPLTEAWRRIRDEG